MPRAAPTLKYEELLREKNRLVDLYKRSALDFQDLSALKDSIEAKKGEARAILDGLLLNEFRGLGIQFEAPTWDNQAAVSIVWERRWY